MSEGLDVVRGVFEAIANDGMPEAEWHAYCQSVALSEPEKPRWKN